MPTWKVELIPEAHADFNELDGSVRKQVLKQLVKLEQDPKYGVPLGNKADRFPFAVYYKIENEEIRVYAVVDCRKNPAWIRKKLQ